MNPNARAVLFTLALDCLKTAHIAVEGHAALTNNSYDNLPVYYRFCHCFKDAEAAEGHVKGSGTIPVLTLINIKNQRLASTRPSVLGNNALD